MDSLDRKLAIKSLFDSQGYKMFKEELDALFEACYINRDNASAEPCSSDKLNFINGIKQGLNSVDSILLGFREELEESAEGR